MAALWLCSGENAKDALMRVTEEWSACVDNGGKIGVIFMNFSKAFDFS